MKHLRLNLSGWIRHGSDSLHSELEELAERAGSAARATLERRDSGDIGFFDLPEERATARRAMEYAASLPAEVDTMVVLGIGGSSLGPHAVYSALAHPYDAYRERAPGMPRRLFFPDNSDPATLAALLEVTPLERTVFNVVTKSGSTAETAAQLLVVADAIERRLGAGALARHLVVTTDPEKGPLRALAQRHGLTCFDVPPNVGGRFSVLSAVGLVPAAAAGLDVIGLLDGAASVRERVLDPATATDLWNNPALLFAAALYLHDTRHGRPMVVLMPYADGLYDTADWFRQLWAESLGKARGLGGEPAGVGPTPIASRGATDQHSQLQLYAEGPDDKTYLFLHPESRPSLTIPRAAVDDTGDYSYLAGVDMATLIEAERRGTMSSLARRGRPVASLGLERLSAEAVGATMYFFEAATAFAGPLYGVDAFDQPGVEEAKRLAFAALGRDGYEEYASQLDTEDRDERFQF